MTSFNLSVRYAREVTDPGVPCIEDNFELGHCAWNFPVNQCALVMVDCWSTHVVDSHLRRGGMIAEKQILPVLQAFRAAGMAVVHAPAPETAHLYSEFLAHADALVTTYITVPHSSHKHPTATRNLISTGVSESLLVVPAAPRPPSCVASE